MQLPMIPPGHHIPPEAMINHEQYHSNMRPIHTQFGPPPNLINPSFNHFLHPEYRIYELNRRLQQRSEESDNLWWEGLVSQFFEDDAKLTMSFCLEDGPKRYCISRTLIPRFFRSVFEGGAIDLYFLPRHWKEIYHGPHPHSSGHPNNLNSNNGENSPSFSKNLHPPAPPFPSFLTMDCEQATMVTVLDKPMLTKIVSEGRLILDFFVLDDILRIKRWHFIIRHHTELIPRNILAMQDPSVLEQLSKNVTRSGLTNTTLNYLRLCVILEPMAELMSRHKAYALSPRDCMKTTLFQKWQKIMGNSGTYLKKYHVVSHHPSPLGPSTNGAALFHPHAQHNTPQIMHGVAGPGGMPPMNMMPGGGITQHHHRLLGHPSSVNGRPSLSNLGVAGAYVNGNGSNNLNNNLNNPGTSVSSLPPTTTKQPKTRRKRKSDNNSSQSGPSPGKKRGSFVSSSTNATSTPTLPLSSSPHLPPLNQSPYNNNHQSINMNGPMHHFPSPNNQHPSYPPLHQAQMQHQHQFMQSGGLSEPHPSNYLNAPPPPSFAMASQDVMIVGEPTLMGGEFGDEDERLIARLENVQYQDSSSSSSMMLIQSSPLSDTINNLVDPLNTTHNRRLDRPSHPSLFPSSLPPNHTHHHLGSTPSSLKEGGSPSFDPPHYHPINQPPPPFNNYQSFNTQQFHHPPQFSRFPSNPPSCFPVPHHSLTRSPPPHMKSAPSSVKPELSREGELADENETKPELFPSFDENGFNNFDKEFNPGGGTRRPPSLPLAFVASNNSAPNNNSLPFGLTASPSNSLK
ncbi:LIM domain-binding protein 1-like isoform X2 [Gordionus sp. m RMFG-2023]|uniref:LIM domain-binding protein 1-like isoform X2 n=1 Tax=Gordionus sp. m RMFG-2023 TaxID=3053472 RepID=UPI0031FC4C1B